MTATTDDFDHKVQDGNMEEIDTDSDEYITGFEQGAKMATQEMLYVLDDLGLGLPARKPDEGSHLWLLRCNLESEGVNGVFEWGLSHE